MQMIAEIKARLSDAFSPHVLHVLDESHLHHTPKDMISHIRIQIISASFLKMSKVQRHQMIYKALDDFLPKLHAIAIQAFDPDESHSFEDNKAPACRGGFRKS